ncbi:MAG: UbiA family prenyltransferase [Candidatus Omnitrophica bacterium]|nr:UbiA family prenyltransferase [Candidatus Omnitrophota bacterium]
MLFWKFSKRIISYIESPRIPLFYCFLIFLSAVTLRNFLELFSDTAQISLTFYPAWHPLFFSVWLGLCISFLHYYALWLALFLALAIILSTLTKEDISKVLKTVFAFSIIVNITPVLDLLVSGGKGMNISYLYPKNLLEFLPVPKGLTPGMILTSGTGIGLSFIYGKVKTNSSLKGFISSLSFYLLLAAASMLPLLLNVRHPLPIIRFLSIVVFMESLIVFYRLKKSYFICLFKDIRWLRLLHFYSMLILGMILAGAPLPGILKQNAGAFLLILLSTSLCWLVAVIFNNIEDLGIDKITNPGRPLASAAIPKQDYLRIAGALSCLALVMALAVNFITFFFALLLIGNSLLYSLPPLRLKRVPIFSKFFISFNSLLAVMLGYIFSGRQLLAFPEIISWYFLVFITLSLNFIDLKDYAGDKEAGIRTLPVIFGPKKAKFIIGLFFLASYAALAGVFVDRRLLAPALAAGVTQFLLINRKSYREKPVLLTYLISVSGVFIYLIFLS